MSRLLPALLLGLLAVACSRRADPVALPPTRAEIWAEIQPLAARYRLEPAFIYALVIAESDGDPRARNGEARGLMQIKPAAWRAVSQVSYEPNIWNWRTNLAAGVDYLAYSRSYLHKQKGVTFSYPLLLAAFHYGLDYVESRQFDASRVPVPDNAIYRELWRGNLAPVAPPSG
jgi:soluble lytic murein transglycosylase-like protein